MSIGAMVVLSASAGLLMAIYLVLVEIRDEIRKLNHILRKPPYPPDIEREP